MYISSVDGERTAVRVNSSLRKGWVVVLSLHIHFHYRSKTLGGNIPPPPKINIITLHKMVKWIVLLIVLYMDGQTIPGVLL